MPKNKGKGGKNRRRGKNEADEVKRELLFKEDGQEYAKVTKMLGNGRLEAEILRAREKRDGDMPDGATKDQKTTILAHIRGKMRKKVWINVGDIILLAMRDFQDDKADVIHKYTPDEARNLKAYGEIPDDVDFNETEGGGDEVQFGEGSDEEEEEEVDIDDI